MKTNYIRFRCTEEQKDAFQYMANQSGMTMTDYIIGKVLGDSNKVCFSEIELHRGNAIKVNGKTWRLVSDSKTINGKVLLLFICENDNMTISLANLESMTGTKITYKP